MEKFSAISKPALNCLELAFTGNRARVASTGYEIVKFRKDQWSSFKRDKGYANILNLPGVYVLVGESTLYIGETGQPDNRMDSHLKDKSFWEWGIIFTDKNDLNEAHIKYIEAKLLVEKDKYNYYLNNKACPKFPTLSPWDEKVAERFRTNFVIPVLELLLPKPLYKAESEGNHPASSPPKKVILRDTVREFLDSPGAQAAAEDLSTVIPNLVNVDKNLLRREAASHKGRKTRDIEQHGKLYTYINLDKRHLGKLLAAMKDKLRQLGKA